MLSSPLSAFFYLVDKFKSFFKPFSMGNYADLLDFLFLGRFTCETERTFFCVKFLPKKACFMLLKKGTNP